MKRTYPSGSVILIVLSIGSLFFLLIFSQLKTTLAKEVFSEAEDKHKGVHVFGDMDSLDFQTLAGNNIEWITLVEWGYQDDYDSPELVHRFGDSLKVSQHDADLRKQIKSIRAAGFKVFFKPHLWLWKPSEGKWRSDIFPTEEKNWQLWKESYRDFYFPLCKDSRRKPGRDVLYWHRIDKIDARETHFLGKTHSRSSIDLLRENNLCRKLVR